MAKKMNSTDKNEETAAMVALSSTINAAVVIQKYTENLGTVDLMALMDQLQSKYTKVNQGDFEKIETMLLDQANVLQAIFSRLALNGIQAKCTHHLDVYLRLALKAQSQCARTLATLHGIKHPSNTSFIKQTNIGENVQVNNGLTCSPDSQEKISKSSNKLLEKSYHGTWMDSRTTHETISPHPHLEAVR